MIASMTGFAAGRGTGAGHSWAWDIRSVNGKGLDLRLRVPDWIDGLELAIRAELQKAIVRGNVSLTMKIARDGLGDGAETIRVNEPALRTVLATLAMVDATAASVGIALERATAADVLAMRGVLDTTSADEDTGPLRAAVLADLPGLIANFTSMRRAEGTALGGIVAEQLDQIAALTRRAGIEAATRRATQTETLRDAVARVLEVVDSVDEARLAQELALLAVKTDVQEELDRLAAHVDAARALLSGPGPVGRKFDFLMQEFMREANTLCSKAQALTLTRIGLDLKTVIDQMREQVQNIE